MEPFIDVVQSGLQFDLIPCQDSINDGIQLLVWTNLPCSNFRIEHIQKQTLTKIVDPNDQTEYPIFATGMQASHDVQNFQVKIQDVYSKMPALIEKFKSYECHLKAMITIALRVFVKHNDVDEAVDSQGGSFIG